MLTKPDNSDTFIHIGKHSEGDLIWLPISKTVQYIESDTDVLFQSTNSAKYKPGINGKFHFKTSEQSLAEKDDKSFFVIGRVAQIHTFNQYSRDIESVCALFGSLDIHNIANTRRNLFVFNIGRPGTQLSIPLNTTGQDDLYPDEQTIVNRMLIKIPSNRRHPDYEWNLKLFMRITRKLTIITI